ncbi:MAG TPA: uridine kinase [Acidobacteriota bacterium]|nr:uridine kinase [Acidobacteriota bacterium]HNB71400.1 uridine kinase [Acidobacteriota bacterium]HND18072.1 uridine kinase [Acidobacteriota bacterium]HNH83842.1 uridine kinase [Acidobacteriota bacterium]HNJ40431.1 uridine kinase [Acidobacteriota bacterium]
MHRYHDNNAMIIGISGGTGSGKTTVARKIIQAVGPERVTFVQQDAYYRNLGDMPIELRHRVNFDHPDAFDTELLLNHLEALREGETIEQPIYDYVTHSRKVEAIHTEPRPVIIVDGILIFFSPQMRALMDMKIYVDTDADLRFIRRLERDVHERGRSVDSIVNQYLTTVRPMHLQFIEPLKRYADVIIPKGGDNEVGIDLITEKIKAILARAIPNNQG